MFVKKNETMDKLRKILLNSEFYDEWVEIDKNMDGVLDLSTLEYFS